MKRLIVRLFIFISFFFVSCQEVSKKNEEKTENLHLKATLNNPDCFIVDLDNIEQNDFLTTSTIFKNVTPIVLEAADEVLISGINSIQVYKDKLFVMDKRSKALYVFDKYGKFIHKIGKIGQAPEEYVNPSDFTLDSDNKRIYVLDYDQQKINLYDIDSGEHISNIKLENDKIRSYNIQYSDGLLYADAFFPKDDKNNFLLRELDISTGKQKECWLSAQKYNKGFSGMYFTGKNIFLSRNHNPLYSQIFMDTLVSVNKEGVKPYLTIKSKKLLSNKDYIEAKGDSFQDKMSSLMTKDVIHSIQDFFESKDIIFFKYQEKNYISFVIYNKRNHDYKIFKAMKDNLLYSLDYPPLPNFVGYDENGIYASINMDNFLHFFENGQLAENIIKRNELMQLSEDSNPIIFYYEFK